MSEITNYLIIPEDQAAIDATVSAINTGLGESASSVDGKDVLALAQLIVSAGYSYVGNLLPTGLASLPITFNAGATNALFTAAIDISEGGNKEEAAITALAAAIVGQGASMLARAAIVAGAAALGGVSASPCIITIGTVAFGYVATKYAMEVLKEGYDAVVGYETLVNYNKILDKVTITSKRSALDNILRHNWESGELPISQRAQWEISTEKGGELSGIKFENPGTLIITDSNYSNLHAYITNEERLAATVFILDNIGDTFQVSFDQGSSYVAATNFSKPTADIIASVRNGEQEALWAIQNLSPFALETDPVALAGNAEDFSDKYIEDRSAFLYYRYHPDVDLSRDIEFIDKLRIVTVDAHNELGDKNIYWWGTDPDLIGDGKDEFGSIANTGDDHLYGSSLKAFSPHRAVFSRRAGSRSLAA